MSSLRVNLARGPQTRKGVPKAGVSALGALAFGDPKQRYRAMIGTGGVGSGTFFALNGNHTLGREESRSGKFLDRRDYCKLHIISHYVQVLMGPGGDTKLGKPRLGTPFVSLPISRVGQDEVGLGLLEEMRQVGLDLRYMQSMAGEQTMYAVCFVYPDGSGGNLTVDDSACGHVGPQDIRRAEDDFRRFAGAGIALAAPEVPLSARAELLELATKHRFFRAASFVSAEMPEVRERRLLEKVDLLAINIHEARALLGRQDTGPTEQVEAPQSRRTSGRLGTPLGPLVTDAVEGIRGMAPRLWVSITAGKQGSWSWDGKVLNHVPIYDAPVVSTAGAGDAHMAGILVGLARGLSLPEAQQLGTLLAALKVTSPHTINKDIDRRSLAAFARGLSARPGEAVLALLENGL